MDLKLAILGVSIVLMVAVVLLSVAGIVWAAGAPTPPPLGGRVVLAVSAVAALLCLWRLWTTRHDHLG